MGWGLLYTTFLPTGRLRLQMVICLTQDYAKEPVFRPLFAMVIAWNPDNKVTLIKMLGKYTVSLQRQV